MSDLEKAVTRRNEAYHMYLVTLEELRRYYHELLKQNQPHDK